MVFSDGQCDSFSVVCLKTKVRTSLDEKNEQNSGLDFLSLLDGKKYTYTCLSQKKDITRKKISARFRKLKCHHHHLRVNKRKRRRKKRRC